MNTADLIDHLCAVDPALTKVRAKVLVTSLVEAIKDAVVADEELTITGFGKFKVKETPPRKARNPRTGESVDVPETRKIVFVPAKALKDAVKG